MQKREIKRRCKYYKCLYINTLSFSSFLLFWGLCIGSGYF